jgi:ribosome-associated toxin RatA of RatAB toxin-antitoxin module
MSRVRESVDVAVPVHVAYERLCHFEEYPQFMTDVQEVTQISDDMAHWVMDFDGTAAEFDARITDQRPDELLAWQTIDGPRLAEKMTFQRLAEDRTRIVAELDLDAKAFMPSEAHAKQAIDRRLKADLASFKQYIEADISGTMSPPQLGLDRDTTPPNPALGDGGVLGGPSSTRSASSHAGGHAGGLGAGLTGRPGPMNTGRRSRPGQMRGGLSSPGQLSADLEDI